jgi:VanZ family protein
MKRLLAAAFWLALMFTLVMALLPKPPQLPGSPTDKLQHILAFLTLATLASAAYPRLAWWRIVGGLAAFGALIELGQTIPVLHRTASWADWIADCVAVALVMVLRYAAVAAARRASRRGA